MTNPRTPAEALTTLAEAREVFFRNAEEDGSDCPCCDRYGKIYKRKLHSAMAAVLVLLYRHRGLGFVHVHKLNAMRGGRLDSRGDFAKLRHWGLIEESATTQKQSAYDIDKKRQGLWRITESGEAFVEGRIRVYERILIYNTECLGVAGVETVDIHEALGSHFSYAELMNDAVWPSPDRER